MKAIQEIKAELKSNKIGRGCKITTMANCLTIVYPKCKLHNPDFNNYPFKYNGSQKQKDIDFIISKYSISVTGNTIVHNNKLAIQIYLTND